MKSLSIHPIEYLRVHLVYEKIRISLLSLLASPIILIILSAIALGCLYNNVAPVDHIDPGVTDHTYINPYPYEMPKVVIRPMFRLPLPPH
jgi:hypothetical protein